MILLNFSHPLTVAQREQIVAQSGAAIDQDINMPVQFDQHQSFAGQVDQLLEHVPISAADWQTESIIVNLPSLNFITALLLAALHGRMGYFPLCIRLRPVAGALPPRFEVAELLNLQAQRDAARKLRQ